MNHLMYVVMGQDLSGREWIEMLTYDSDKAFDYCDKNSGDNIQYFFEIYEVE